MSGLNGGDLHSLDLAVILPAVGPVQALLTRSGLIDLQTRHFWYSVIVYGAFHASIVHLKTPLFAAGNSD